MVSVFTSGYENTETILHFFNSILHQLQFTYSVLLIKIHSLAELVPDVLVKITASFCEEYSLFYSIYCRR